MPPRGRGRGGSTLTRGSAPPSSSTGASASLAQENNGASQNSAGMFVDAF